MLEKERSWSFGEIQDLCLGIRSEMKCNNEHQMERGNLGKGFKKQGLGSRGD